MARDEKMDETRLCNVVGDLVKDAEEYRNERSTDREKMMAFYDGDAKELQAYIPADKGRSQVVSRDVRAAVRKVLPSILRTILGNDEIVEYNPVGEGDEESAQQASDYVNYIALPECKGRTEIEDAINDAVKLRNGVIKWFVEEKVDTKTSRHSGLDEISFAQLVADDDVDVLEHSERQETVEVPGMGPTPVVLHDLKLRRTIKRKMPRIGVIAPENFLIHSDATSFDDAPILGEHCRLRRSDLVAMGYERDKIWALPTAGASDTEQDTEEAARRRDVLESESSDEATKAMQEIDYYDLLVKVDYDGDGIAELRRMVFAGGFSTENLLANDEWDEVNYANIVSERRPHQWEGNSASDEVMEIQKVKTVLLRQTMDNLYWQNNLQPIGQLGAITNPDAMLEPEFGKPIWVEEGVDVRAAVGFNQVPMVADKSFAMLEYMDGEITERTGISDASSGMAPDALQNMTAKASAMMEQAGIGQTEMMVRCIAESLKPVFRGLLKLIIENQDAPRTVRLRDEWVTFDPRSWNADMDAVVNIGLGAGTRERDMMMMQQVIGLQREILSSMGPAVGMQYVKPDNLYNGISKFVEAAGLKSIGLYFTQPDPQAIEQAIKAQAEQPSPEEIKAQAAMALEDKRTQGKMAIEQFKGQQKMAEFTAKIQADASKEREQRDADLITELQQIQAEAEARMEEAYIKAQSNAEDNAVDLQREQMKQQTEREWMGTQTDIAAAKIIADVQQSRETNAARSLDRQRQPDGNREGRSGQ
ncbi:hypothetical protein GCM10007989_07460 [Devosia pacifica]|uniref:Phage portal protein n=1 Tax=Devosia pacifica TaxID=1335967 RepID=A0A918VQL9_9HYPH|nr:phage portal protein [Devosia pacifica]GHA15210.1 hypothetical protein GCM10007989_07460 [Devosia pacifica]